MAHELTSNTSMFSVGEVPWHGLGKVIGDAPTAADAIKLAELDWEVTTVDNVILKNPVTGEEMQDARSKAILHATTGRVLGTGGPNYHPLQNVTALDWFNPFLDTGMAKLETAGSLKGGRVCWALARIMTGGTDMAIVGDDVVRKYILLTWGHDGVMGIRAGFSPTRVVCMNTLSAAISEGDRAASLVRIKHLPNATIRLEKAREMMDLANQQFETTAEHYRAMAKRSFTDDQLEAYVMTVLGYEKKLDKARKADPEAELHTRSKEIVDNVIKLVHTGIGHQMPGVSGTWWAAYNGITQYFSHEYGRTQEDRAMNAMMGDGATKNRRAMELATKLALV